MKRKERHIGESDSGELDVATKDSPKNRAEAKAKPSRKTPDAPTKKRMCFTRGAICKEKKKMQVDMIKKKKILGKPE